MRLKKISSKIITLCGSQKFVKEIQEMEAKLTLEGNIVFSLGVFAKTSDEEGKPDCRIISKEQWDNVEKVHLQKILLSNAIFVTNVDGYIGDATRDEIEFAKSHGKEIMYLE